MAISFFFKIHLSLSSLSLHSQHILLKVPAYQHFYIYSRIHEAASSLVTDLSKNAAIENGLERPFSLSWHQGFFPFHWNSTQWKRWNGREP